MQNSSTFQIYNASAGSGKTFTLVKEYLKILLRSTDVFYFQKVLAITFTNKAAGEMKERVLKNLDTFSKGESNDLLQIILQETSLEPLIIQQRSKRIVDAVLQNYSAFSITTIDSFTHKIIKNFAYDLGLTLNFEVEMDAVSLLNEAVDMLVSKIGVDEELTKLLIDFSLSKIDEDKSWDISHELKDFARILLNEEDVKYFRKLRQKSIKEFFNLKKKLGKINETIITSFAAIGNEALAVINNNGLEFSDFAYSGECPKHFKKLTQLKNLKFDELKFEGRLNKNFNEGKKLYAGKADASSKEGIDAIYEVLHELYNKSKELYNETYPLYTLNNSVLKNIIPLAVLNNVNKELEVLKEENNIRLNAEFNQLISDNIKDQPSPFIYERLGQKFMHYYIDEMQDTSVLQWQNLIPLIDNALAQENSGLLLVGDAKQAIYRWRGGKADQFINLGLTATNDFYVAKEVKTLEVNFRSYSELISFNNAFFKHVANFFGNTRYAEMFLTGNNQEYNTKKGGYVTFSFLEKENDKELEKNKYPKKVFEKIEILKKDFSLNEICILVRKKREGVAVANYLSERGINIISSETLLLKNSKKVVLIIDMLQLIVEPSNEDVRFDVLTFLYEHLKIEEEKHLFFKSLIKESITEFFEKLQYYNVQFNIDQFFQLPFYEKVEELIRSFRLIDSSDAYIHFFLDVVLEQQQKGVNIQEFLEYWEVKKESLSIVSPEGSDAVNIMTIHKSKGLEFPVVIFPYDLDIYRQVKPKVWFDELPEVYEGFDEFLIDYNRALNTIGDKGVEIFEQQRQELELDNFNLLYVALTRAVEQLHIIAEKKLTRNIENTNYYSGLFISFLKKQGIWDDVKLEYTFGEPNRISEKIQLESTTTYLKNFVSIPWQQHNITLLSSSSKLWATNQGLAIDYGNLIHELMAKINTVDDVEHVLQHALKLGEISEENHHTIKRLLFQLINHKQLNEYYSPEVQNLNEREIILDAEDLIIPDRLVFKDGKVTIIDYKTGMPDKKHINQINKYASSLEKLNHTINKKMLVYINDAILVEEIE